MWLKAWHLIGMVTWFAGLFYLPRLFVYHAMSDDRPSIERFKIMERKLYFGITTTPWPAFICVVTLLAWQVGGWRTGLFALLGLAFMLVTGVWPQAMLSVYLCAAAVLLAFALGAATGRVAGLRGPSRRALTFEIGIQNSGLGLLILLSQFQGLGGAAVVTALWGIWHLVSGSALAFVFRLVDNVGRPAADAA